MNTRIPVANPPRAALFGALFALVAWSAQAELRLQLSVLDQPVTRGSNAESTAKGSPTGSFRLGEPVPVRLELTNVGSTPEEIFPSLDPAAGFVTLFVAGPETNSPQRFTTLRWETKDHYFKRRPLSPGDKLVHETFLFGRLTAAGKLEYAFPRPGKYEIHVLHGSGITSAPVRLELSAPGAEWARLQSAGIVGLMEGRLKTQTEVARKSAEILGILNDQPAHQSRVWLEQRAQVDAAR